MPSFGKLVEADLNFGQSFSVQRENWEIFAESLCVCSLLESLEIEMRVEEIDESKLSKALAGLKFLTNVELELGPRGL